MVRKYEPDESIQTQKAQLADRQAEVQFKEDQLPELSSRLAVLQRQADDVERELDAFNFGESERAMMRELVGTLETARPRLMSVFTICDMTET